MVIDGIELFGIPGALGYFADCNGDIWTQYGLGWKPNMTLENRVPKRLKASPNSLGYPVVSLLIDGKRKHALVSHLVLRTFVGPRPPGMEACHDPDPSPLNNRPNNLRWDTHAANMRDKRKHGTSRLKVKPDIMAELIRLYVDEKKTAEEAGNSLGISTSTVSRWLKQDGLTRRRTRGKSFVRSAALMEGTTDFGRKMAALRIAANLSQLDIQKATGIHCSLISNIEHGQIRATRREVIESLAVLYGQDPDKLWAEAPKRKVNDESKAELIRRYVEQRLTLEDAVRGLNFTPTTASRLLRKLGLNREGDRGIRSALAGKTAFGRKLAELRLAKGLTQPQVSAAIGGLISGEYLGRIELGIRKTASKEVVKALAELYAVEVGELLAVMGPRGRGARDLQRSA